MSPDKNTPALYTEENLEIIEVDVSKDTQIDEDIHIIPDITEDNREILYRYATAYLKNFNIGQYNQYEQFFNDVVRLDLRDRGIGLLSVFDKIDGRFIECNKNIAKLRVGTGSTHLLYHICLISTIIFANSYTHFLFSAMVLAFLSIVTSMFRSNRLANLELDAQKFGSSVFRDYTGLKDKAFSALKNERDSNISQDSGKHAKQWSLICLWLYDIMNVFSDYVAMSDWRIQRSIQLLRYALILFNIIIWAISAFITYNALYFNWAFFDLFVVIFAISSYIATWFFWDFGFLSKARKARIAWQNSFKSQLNASTETEKNTQHIFIQLADRVGTLKDQYINKN